MAGIALITGTSTGIGLATAVALAKAGYTTVATMRDTARAGALQERAAAEGVTVELERLDVTDQGSIDAAISAVIDRHERIDVLVNNAGSGFLGTVEQTSTEDARRVFDVDFFGVWSMTKAVLPHMRAAGSGRIINIASVGGIAGQPFNDAYCAAKFAVEGLSEALAPVARRLGIHVSVIEPGAVNTSFVDTVASAAAPLFADSEDPYRPLLDSYLAATREHFEAGQTGDDVAEVIVKALSDDPPHMRYQTSRTARLLAKAKFADPDGDATVEFVGSRLG
jgi:NAD(P)-dependent dehydrogenase (short-subunit alcohol dehydrogenase family)